MVHLNRSVQLMLGVVLPLAVACSQSPAEDMGATNMAATAMNSDRVPLTLEEIAIMHLTVKPVVRSEFRKFQDFQGTVELNAHAWAEITPIARGRVVAVHADLGQEVTAGQLLAVLYSEDLGAAQSAYLQADAKLSVARQAHARAKGLLAEKVIGVGEGQRRQGEMISLRADNREAQDRLRLLGMSQEETHRLHRDHTLHSYVSVKAPFTSRVIARNLTQGEIVETTDKLFVVADLSEVWVTANIPEKDVDYIYHNHAKEQFVEVRVLAYPHEVFQGKITYVGDVLDHVTRTMRLRIELPNVHRLLKPQMYATIRVYSDPEPNVLLVDERAVQRTSKRTFVFVQRQIGLFEARDVKLGDSNGRQIKVLDGLKEGEQIVEEGAFVLKSELLEQQM